jgi:hypothetical protein
VSEPPQPAAASQGQAPDEHADSLPVIAGEARLLDAQRAAAAPAARPAGAIMPAVQAAAVAAGGFVAGAAVVGLVHRRQRRSHRLAAGRRGRRGQVRGERSAGVASELVQIVGSRSLLVDVHLLGGSGDR